MVRPTARRLRESLFELLGLRIANARFLDLCAGSGAVGIEALSRGAAHATFVDRSAEMCGYVNSNLELCGVLPEQSSVFEDDATQFLQRMSRSDEAAWEIAFFDPPYAADYLSVIEQFAHTGLLKSKGGILVVEHHSDNQLGDRFGLLHRWRVIRQGESCLSFYERKK
jgi:16S rRNA (guanine(966)-N(2))-methyltransferase RsmD